MLKLSNEELEVIRQSNLSDDLKEKLLSLTPYEIYLSHKETVIDDLESVLDAHYDMLFEDLPKDRQEELIHQYHNMSFQDYDEKLAEIVCSVIG